jgi:glutamate racemase
MHGGQYDDLFLASTYVNGLKEEIRAVVEPQVPTTVDRAVTIAKTQQRVLERSKLKFQRGNAANRPQPVKPDSNKNQGPYGTLWRIGSSETIGRPIIFCF